MNDLRFNEYKVLEWEYNQKGKILFKNGKPVIKNERKSDRGVVTITQDQADMNNAECHKTGLRYELEKKAPESKFAGMTKAKLKEYVEKNEYDVDVTMTNANIIKEIEEIEK